jgi:hypothetical protein
MKVAHFHFGTEGGAERFFVNLANSLAERGVEQKIVIRPIVFGAMKYPIVVILSRAIFAASHFPNTGCNGKPKE